MHPPARDYLGSPFGLRRAPLEVPADRSPCATQTPFEQDADTTATDWQITLQLKKLFARDPALISTLLEGPDDERPAAYAITLLAGAREALAARPDSADLHYHAARAAARIGKTRDTRAWLNRALELNPCHVEALALLADVCMESNEPDRAIACLRRALAAGAFPTSVPLSAEQHGRGNELPT
jgi:tetratricopeptide (TPR) repeat protein